jgi:hypothetical protein
MGGRGDMGRVVGGMGLGKVTWGASGGDMKRGEREIVKVK